MKLLSESCEYGLRAVVWMAQRPGEPQKVKDIADQIKAAPGYLVKVLQDLTKAGILSARRGSRGGFTLECDPETLTAYDVITAIDPLERILTCPLETTGHGETLCPIHRRIDDVMRIIEDNFRQLTIQEVVLDTTSSSCEVLCPRAANRPTPLHADITTR